MCYLMNGMQVDQKIASMNNASLEHCLSLLKKSSVGSLAVNDNDRFNTYKLQKFLHMSHQVEHYSAQRNEAFPGELLTPKQDVVVPTNIIDRLVEFYQRSYACNRGEWSSRETLLGICALVQASLNCRNPFHKSPDKQPNNCLAELWDTEFSEEAADCMLPVHNILGRFLPSTIEVANSQGRYLAVVPLNRRFYI